MQQNMFLEIVSSFRGPQLFHCPCVVDLPSEWLDRLVIVPGDLSQPQCGLSDSHYKQLSAEIDYIVHSGATVNWLVRYVDLRAPNVIATADLLKFAASSAKPFIFISSLRSDRKSVVEGKSVSLRVDLGGRSRIKKKK